MFQELSTSLKAQLYERVSSPILGTIAVFWFIFNWEGIAYFLLSGSTIEDKLTYIDCNFKDFDKNVFYPLLYSSIFCLAYPLVSFIPFYIWEWTSSQKIKSKNNLSMSEPLSVERSIAIRKELLDKETKIRTVIVDHNQEKEDLEKIINSLKSDNARLYKKILTFEAKRPSENIELNEEQETVLGYFSKLEDDYYYIPSDIIGDNDVTVEYAVTILNYLVSKGLLKKSAESDEGEDGYEITTSGRKYLAEKIINEHDDQA
jgi:DNA-binding MarR family transcriptional regulator